jgi:hypothetical protein
MTANRAANTTMRTFWLLRDAAAHEPHRIMSVAAAVQDKNWVRLPDQGLTAWRRPARALLRHWAPSKSRGRTSYFRTSSGPASKTFFQ